MRSTDEIRRDFVEALDEEADARLSALAFRRRRSKDDFVRRPRESVQRLVFRPNYKPRFHKGSEIYLYPLVWVEIPAIGAKALEITGGNSWALANAPGLILNEPIDWSRGDGQRGFWHATDKLQMRTCIVEAVSFVERRILPRLDDLQTIQDFIRQCESRGVEKFAKGPVSVHIAAAYLLLNNRNAARQILEGKHKPRENS
jgi:hypothetical protein